MKILLNGFELEINTEDTQMTVKVIDAEGQELANNTYAQKVASDEVKPTSMPSAQEVQPAAQAQPEPEAQPGVQNTGDEPEAQEESLIPSLETLKMMNESADKSIPKNRINTLELALSDAHSGAKSIENVQSKKDYKVTELTDYRNFYSKNWRKVKKFIEEFGEKTVLDSIPANYQKLYKELVNYSAHKGLKESVTTVDTKIADITNPSGCLPDLAQIKMMNEDELSGGAQEDTVTVSDYMKSRQYNQKLMGRLIEKLKAIVARNSKEFPGLHMEISMSAKYQKPYIKITTADGNFERLGGIEGECFDAIDEVGYTQTEVDEKNGAYYIEFED